MGPHAALVPKRGLFFDGHWVEPLKGKRIPTVNPTTEESVGDIPAATSEDVDAAVKAAKDAFYRNKGQDWAKASGKHRATFLRAIAKRVAERKSELAKLESIDCGKPIDEAEWDLDDVSGCFEYYADLAEKLDERQDSPLELAMEQFKCNIRREAMGLLVSPRLGTEVHDVFDTLS